MCIPLACSQSWKCCDVQKKQNGQSPRMEEVRNKVRKPKCEAESEPLNHVSIHFWFNCENVIIVGNAPLVLGIAWSLI